MTLAKTSYSSSEAAQLLQVSVQTIQKWVDAGHVQAWKTLGGHRRISADSLHALMQRQGLTPPDAPLADSPAILIAEDNPDDAELLQTQIRRLCPSARLTVVSDGFEALLQIGRACPDWLFTDVMMPGMNGVAMIRRLQLDPASHALRIVVMTSHTPQEIAALGDLPANVHWLAKPLERTRLAALLDSQAVPARGPA
jgi:excisionase family DNA binding protein